MKKHLLFSALTVAAALLVSCQKEGGKIPEQKEIRLSTTISRVDVKAAFPETDTQLADGTEVRVWVDETAETAVPLYENNVFTANGEGGLYGGETMYYPASGNPVNIYALKTNAAITGNTYPAGALQHSVSTDQTALEDFVSSDLLYADATSVTNDVEVVPLTFYHLLTKVQVAVTPSEGLVKEDISGLELNGVQILAEYTLSKSVSPDAVEIVPEGEIRTIVIGHDISDNFETPAYNDAVIVPQTLEAGTTFIVVTLLDGTRLAYQLPESATFTAQTAYQYHITVKRDGMVVTTSVTDWLPGGIELPVTPETDTSKQQSAARSGTAAALSLILTVNKVAAIFSNTHVFKQILSQRDLLVDFRQPHKIRAIS